MKGKSKSKIGKNKNKNKNSDIIGLYSNNSNIEKIFHKENIEMNNNIKNNINPFLV